MGSTSDSDVFGPGSYLKAKAHGNEITDLNNALRPTPASRLELRLEMYRVRMIDYDDGNGPQKLKKRLQIDNYPGSSLKWRSDNEANLFWVSRSWPTHKDVAENDRLFDVEKDNPGQSVYQLSVLPPFDLASQVVPTEKEYNTIGFWPTGGPSALPMTDFASTPNPYFISTCFNESLEMPFGIHKYQYILFTCVNDKNNNYSYGYDPSFQYFGELEDVSGEEDVFAWDYESEFYGYMTPISVEKSRGTSSVGLAWDEVQSGYDIAYNPVGDEVGWTFVDGLTSKLHLVTLNRTTGVRRDKTICTASVGNTSLAFDLDGHPHVAYYLDSDDDEAYPDTGSQGGHTGSSIRTASVAFWGKVFYRDFDGSSWSYREEVISSNVAASSEHTLSIRPNVNEDPVCLVPSLGSLAEQIPAYAKKTSSTDWSYTSLSINDPNSNDYMDSVLVGETMYVAVHKSDAKTMLIASADLSLPTPVWSYSADFPVSNVAGHQSITQLDAANLGVAFQIDDGNGNRILQYGVYNIATELFTLDVEVPVNNDSGYHASLTTDAMGNPLIHHINLSEGKTLVTYYDGEDWGCFGWSTCNSQTELNRFNSTDIVRVNDTYYYVFMGSSGKYVNGYFIIPPGSSI